MVERTTFNGKVYDDTNAPLDGVTVTAKSLNTSVAYEVSTTTAGGTYAFNNAPAGVQIEITASRNGYTTRRRVEVLKSNKEGDPDANRYDFGTASSESSGFGTEFNALSDKPEVTMVTPGRNASGINPATSFVLKFSEPMDRQTVTDAFEIRAFGGQGFNVTAPQQFGEQLTVDDEITFNSGTASDGQLIFAGDKVWDKAAFNASWNSDDTEVTMTFKEERALPTDTESENVPDYSVSFEGGEAGIKDKSGITRDEKHFKLTEGRFENYYKFSINTDEVKPSVNSVTVIDGQNSGSDTGDTIKVQFSERMIHRTLSASVAGGMNGQPTEAAGANNNISSTSAAANYRVTVTRGGQTIMNQADWSSLGGGAVFDSNDATNKTVLLLPPTGSMSYNLVDYTYGSSPENMTVLFTFTDGTTYQQNATGISLTSTDYGVTSNTLATALGVSGGGLTLEEATNAGGGTEDEIDSGDTYFFRFNSGATASNGSIQKPIASALLQSGTNLDKIGLSAGTLFVTSSNGEPNVFNPGDNVEVRVNTTVLDPAGNSVDSSNNDASAVAS